MTSTSFPSHVVMRTDEVDAVLERLAAEIVGQAEDSRDLVLIGIQTGGVQVARDLGRRIEQRCGHPVPLGHLDVAMHRDDLDHRLAPAVHPTSIPLDISDKVVVLVDDVLCSGRTGRAALDALTDLGRPRRVQLAVLIDRGLRELPIHADFVGKSLVTQPGDRVDVRFSEARGGGEVVIEPASPS